MYGVPNPVSDVVLSLRLAGTATKGYRLEECTLYMPSATATVYAMASCDAKC